MQNGADEKTGENLGENAGRQEATRFGSSQPNIAHTLEKSVGTGEAPHKRKNLTSVQINRARRIEGAQSAESPAARITDAGDGGLTVPFTIDDENDRDEPV